MANFYTDNEDIGFQLDSCIEWDKIIPDREAGFRDAGLFQNTGNPSLEYAPANTSDALEIYKNVYQTVGMLAAKELAPFAMEMDQTGLKLEDGKVEVPVAMQRFVQLMRESGLLGTGLDRQYGGMHMPITAQIPVYEILARADAATYIVTSYFNMGEIIARFGSAKLKAEYMNDFAAGKTLGAMALTEPDYGSDLSQIKAKAVHLGDDRYEITGTKRFITQACGFGDDVKAAIYTIARVGSAAGARGVSFFLVDSDDVEISRLEDKIGLHASATCEVIYDKTPARLIGEEGRGLTRYAMTMMNGARLGIATQSLGIAQAAQCEALKYASERKQFGMEIQKIPAVRRLLDENEARLQATRALIYDGAQVVDYHELRTQILEAEGLDERAIRKDDIVSHWDKIAKLLTPTAKLLASEFCCRIAYDSLQVHGGVGYTEEFPIAKIYRDARITTIYEGTSQLQVVAMIGCILEGVGQRSVLREYIENRLSELEEEEREKIGKHWQDLQQSVALYRELEKADREALSQDIAWHFAYMYTAMLMFSQVQIAREADLSFRAVKEAVASDYFMIADREIQACIRQVQNVCKSPVAV